MTKKILVVFAFLLLVAAGTAYANKTAVAVVAPEAVAAGTEVTITINVTHSANNAFHHTKLVTLEADGQEIARWEYSPSKLPESANFSVQTLYTVAKPVELTAQGHCNVHGSKGPVTVKIGIQ